MWWNCSLWGARGTALEQYLSKGSNVTVAGVASFRSYEKNGETRTSAECKVSEISLQGGKSEGGTSSARQAPSNPRRAARSEERRGGEEGGNKGRSRWWPRH